MTFVASVLVKEPISDTDFGALVKWRAGEYAPVRALAERLAEEQRA